MGCRAFTILLNLAWFLLIKRFIVKNPLRFYWEIICSIHYLHFLFKKPVPSQVLKDFSVENIQTIPSTFLSKFSSEICLSWTINYWVNYLVWFCVLSVFFSFFLSCFFPFSILFSLTDTNDSQDIRKQRGNNYFTCFLLPFMDIHLVHRDFYHSF